MKTISIVILSLFFTTAYKATAQVAAAELQAAVKAGIDPYFVDSRDTVSKYGPKCITRDVVQDRNGNIWLATWHGIIAYDGKLFINHTLKDGLIHFHVISCYRDKKDMLWFGTARGGMYRYDGRSFTLFTTKHGLVDNSVTCYAEDKKGNIWFGTNNGLSCYDGKQFTNFTTQDGLKTNNIGAIMQDKKGQLWVGCLSTTVMTKDGGISHYDGKAFTSIANNKAISDVSVTSLLEDSGGSIWIGTFSGLIKYDGRTFTTVTDLPNYLTYYIIQAKNGDVWFTSGSRNAIHSDFAQQNLYRYNGKEYSKLLEQALPGDNQIFGKIEDKDGHIWLGTMKGIVRYDGKDFTAFTR